MSIETYNVSLFTLKSGRMLSMSRIDGREMGYKEIQSVKTQVLGDTDAIMLFPNLKNNIDNANEYHLILCDNIKIPFGLHNYENEELLNLLTFKF
jgi:hypothetical protein